MLFNRNQAFVSVAILAFPTALRRAEDIGGQELVSAEVKAIASGNPAVLTLAEADAKLKRLSILRRTTCTSSFSPGGMSAHCPRPSANWQNGSNGSLE